MSRDFVEFINSEDVKNMCGNQAISSRLRRRPCGVAE